MTKPAPFAPAAAGHTAPLADRLAHFPVALFSSVMGVAGLALAWTKAHHVLGAPAELGLALRWAATALYVLLWALFLVKCVRHPQALHADLGHPVKINFFAAISIGLLMLSMLWWPSQPQLAQWLWGVGALAHLLVTLYAMSSWIFHTHYAILHANPAWFVPVVGNILVPVAGAAFAPLELRWFFFSIGLVFWPMLMTVILYRLFFHEPLPPKLMPTLFILIAPPAVGCLAYIGLVNDLDAFARILYAVALFITLLLASNMLRFVRLPFAISAWAYTFPLAAMALASFTMAARTGVAAYGWLAQTCLAVLSVLVLLLAFKTVQAAWHGHVLVAE